MLQNKYQVLEEVKRDEVIVRKWQDIKENINRGKVVLGLTSLQGMNFS